MAKANEREKRPTDFVEMLMEMRDGKVVQDISAKFNELLDAVLDVGEKGKLTIDINLEPSRKGPGGVVMEVQANHSVKSKIPQLRLGKSTFFVTPERRLSRTDPDQARLFGADEESVEERKQ